MVYGLFKQSKAEVKKESEESSPPEAACLCSPPAAKNQCASCGMEIQDRYLLKVRDNSSISASSGSVTKYFNLPSKLIIQIILWANEELFFSETGWLLLKSGFSIDQHGLNIDLFFKYLFDIYFFFKFLQTSSIWEMFLKLLQGNLDLRNRCERFLKNVLFPIYILIIGRRDYPLSLIATGQQPELALGLFGVLSVQSVTAPTQQLLRQKQRNLLQTGLFQVSKAQPVRLPHHAVEIFKKSIHSIWIIARSSFCHQKYNWTKWSI